MVSTAKKNIKLQLAATLIPEMVGGCNLVFFFKKYGTFKTA